MTDEHTPKDADDAPISLQDRWWWSPTLSLGVGIVMVMLQVGSLGDGGVWLNWVVAAVGAVLAVTGLVRLVRAYTKVRAASS